MSIKTQKIVRFIPFVNFFVTFFSLIKSYRSSKQAKVGDILKIVLTMFVSITINKSSENYSFRLNKQ